MRKNTHLLGYVVAADLLVVLLHIAFSSKTTLFHLDFEQNVPTYYQSLKLFGFGVLGLINLLSYRKLPSPIKLFITTFCLILIGMGADELFQVHENIYRVFEHIKLLSPPVIVQLSYSLGFRSSLWIIYYLPLLVAVLALISYWVWYFQKHNQVILYFLLAAFTLITAVVGLELLSSSGNFNNGAYFWLVTAEESAEILAGSVLGLMLFHTETAKNNPRTQYRGSHLSKLKR